MRLINFAPEAWKIWRDFFNLKWSKQKSELVVIFFNCWQSWKLIKKNFPFKDFFLFYLLWFSDQKVKLFPLKSFTLLTKEKKKLPFLFDFYCFRHQIKSNCGCSRKSFSFSSQPHIIRLSVSYQFPQALTCEIMWERHKNFFHLLFYFLTLYTENPAMKECN